MYSIKGQATTFHWQKLTAVFYEGSLRDNKGSLRLITHSASFPKVLEFKFLKRLFKLINKLTALVVTLKLIMSA